MNAFPATPFDTLHWTAQDIADAVPLRLHQVDLFDAAGDRDAGTDAANEPRQRLRIAHGYRCNAAPATRFRIS